MQIQAVKVIELDVQNRDRSWRRKYLQDYTQAFTAYESILETSELEKTIAGRTLILVGDYHALPACQQFVAKYLVNHRRANNRPIVLCLEAIFSRDQQILEAWRQGEIDEQELRERLRFDIEWGYDWASFYELLCCARQNTQGIYGLDCMPREDLRKIGARDRHAAHKLSEIRERHPGAVILALIGESHLAPAHLPALVRKQLPQESPVTILQNVDALYWKASERHPRASAVQINSDTVCVFNSTPGEKYESYRRCLDRWSDEQETGIDFAPAIYKIIGEMARYFDIDCYSPRNGTQPRFLIDALPEVSGSQAAQLKKLLGRGKITPEEAATANALIAARGCAYLPQLNLFLVHDFRPARIAEEAVRFLHHACQGFRLERSTPGRWRP